MLPAVNPFDRSEAGQVRCDKCGVLLPRESARMLVKSREHGGFLPAILQQEYQERGYYCPTCWPAAHQAERDRQTLRLVLFLVGAPSLFFIVLSLAAGLVAGLVYVIRHLTK